MDATDTTEEKRVVNYTAEEFAGCFGYSREKALFEIKKHDLYDRFSPGTMRIGQSIGINNYISEKSLEKYRAIIEVIKQDAPPLATTPSTTIGIDETPEDYRRRRRNEGAKDIDIAWEVYRLTSSLEKVGRIFHPDPRTTEASTYTHRGKKLLGLK